jgi:hypothetical protein
MEAAPSGWDIDRLGPDRGRELRRLRRRLLADSRQQERAVARGRLRRKVRLAASAALLAVVVIGTTLALFEVFSPWPVLTTLRHLTAAPSCAVARAVGLAPSRMGEPGYWLRHDPDFDGVACESPLSGLRTGI